MGRPVGLWKDLTFANHNRDLIREIIPASAQAWLLACCNTTKLRFVLNLEQPQTNSFRTSRWEEEGENIGLGGGEVGKYVKR